MAMTDPEGPPGGWKKVPTSERFWICEVPMTEVALRLNHGEKQYLVYGEFDTSYEGPVWKEFLYDPIKFLEAEGVPCSKNAHLRILKLPDDGGGASAEYIRTVGERRAVSETALGAFKGEPDRNRSITTTVINHHLGLNPRVAQVLIA